MTEKKLVKELRLAGAVAEELTGLSDVADILQRVSPPGLTAAARQRIDNRLPVALDDEKPRKRWLMPAMASAGAFAILLVTVFATQSALPGSPLYALKRGMEELRVKVDPGYANQIQQNRKQESQELEQQQKLTPAVLEELDQEFKDSSETNGNATGTSPSNNTNSDNSGTSGRNQNWQTQTNDRSNQWYRSNSGQNNTNSWWTNRWGR